MPIFLHINKARFFQKIYKKKLLPVTRENIKFFEKKNESRTFHDNINS